MIWAFIAMWLYAGVNVFLASRDEMDGMNGAGKLFFFFLFLFFWPCYPILVIADS